VSQSSAHELLGRVAFAQGPMATAVERQARASITAGSGGDQVDGLGPGADDPAVAEQVYIQVRYAGYVTRQVEEVARNQRNEKTLIPSGFDYAAVRGLSNEICEKLQATQPESIGQAARIPGMTPAAISLLLVYLKRHRSGRQVA
jgi:tRNA uridine 5-carboxymethylaminomethyl modification enzyme